MLSKTLIVIAGPTAVGKTALSIRLAQYFNTEIISADSRQCYKEMSIGTAKPSKEELDVVKHYFINSHSIFEPLSAGDYEKLALGYAQDIFSRRDVALVSGGTGLYIKALCEGIDEMPGINLEIEQQIKADYGEKGLVWLQQEISKADPVFFKTTAEQSNPHRLIRALSFRLSTGKSIYEYQTGKSKERSFKIIKIGLALSRPELYDRINVRVEQMMQQGLLEEVKALMPYKDLKSLKTVGYSELFDFLENKISLDEAVSLIKQHTRNYAKRQMTWFKKDAGFNWFSPQNEQGLIAYLKQEIYQVD